MVGAGRWGGQAQSWDVSQGGGENTSVGTGLLEGAELSQERA